MAQENFSAFTCCVSFKSYADKQITESPKILGFGRVTNNRTAKTITQKFDEV